MDGICSCNQNIPDKWNLSAYGKSVNTIEHNRISASSSESKDITIFTDEGDKVTISYDQETEASYINFKTLSYQGAFATANDASVTKEKLSRMQAEQFLFENSKNLSISVAGDLNEAELADIKEALKQIDAVMTDLLQGGNISEAADEIEEIRNLKTLSSLEANYRYEKEVWVEHIAVKQTSAYSEYQATERIDKGRHGRDYNSLEKLIEKMEALVEDSKARPSEFLKPLQRLFDKISQRLDYGIPAHDAKRQTLQLIESELIKKVEQMAIKEQSEVTLTIV